MGDDILRNMSSQFTIPTDGPYPSAVDMASDQLWDLISSHSSHSRDPSVIDADHDLVAAAVEDHDTDEYSLEVASHLLGLGDSPSTDSGMSLIVNLGTASLESVDGGFVQGDDDPEYRTSIAQEMLPFSSESLTSSLQRLQTPSSSENDLEPAGTIRRASGAAIVNGIYTNGDISAGQEYTPRASEDRMSRRARPQRSDVSRIIRNGIANRRTPRSAPDVFPYPQRQVRFRGPRQEAEDEEERLYPSSSST
ncbi:hypothetical protein QBC34DRAFT_382171 [Podospora aff. communis PSN243]|uniref:Uncharacterized protein n=1 Tax=Podospora aff. communis PSN243 TaxID=3040156 RepID=A0AAV9GL04_9PEZI|nr:hypothetical protein QBC34DRAFT_382171 [Podospora aff. communis PSN243]